MTVENLVKKPSKTTIKEWLTNQIAEQFKIDPQEIDVDKAFTQYGLDSIIAFMIVGDLEEWLEEEFLEIEIPITLMWDYPTINQATEYLVTKLEEIE